MKKKIVAIVIVVVIGAAVWRYRFLLQAFSKDFSQLASNPVVAQIKRDILTPPPLVGDLTAAHSHLSDVGVIDFTNSQRKANGNLTALTENQKLDEAAAAKLADMFAQQYFEHINPQGKGPSSLADTVAYQYVAIGENLALGNFKDDQALVQAWMNSPGHRENILNTKYTEIGVAVGKGMYQGHSTWLAVQEFGRPATDCPPVSSDLKTQIADLQNQVQIEGDTLQSQKDDLEKNPPQSPGAAQEYNAKVDAYNAAVQAYNAKVGALKNLVSQYNTQVNNFNTCVNK